MNSFYPFLLWLLRHKEWSSSCHAMSPAAECATTSRLNCLDISTSPRQVSQVGLGEVSYPPKYYTAVEVMYTTVWCLHVHHASGRSTRFFPSKCLTVPVYQAVKMQTRSAAALSPTQSSSLNQIPEPPPSMLEAHTVLHTETYICGMTEAIKSADNFQQICVCCYCCCLYNWILTNHKYKKQCPK